MRDGGFHGQAIFLKAATGLSELLIDDGEAVVLWHVHAYNFLQIMRLDLV